MVTITTETGQLDVPALRTATQEIITRAVAKRWPEKETVLGPQSPSVTSYVCRVMVDGEVLIAKYSWLGMSLVSILRGAAGPWENVLEAQRAYVTSADLLTAREAQHLRLLRRLGRPRVCKTAGLCDGVLLTRVAPGATLADELSARPWDTAALLDQVLVELRGLHGPAGAEVLRDAASIIERSVAGVFRRKFGGPAGADYLRSLGADSGLQEFEREQINALLQSAVWRLLKMADGLSARRDTAVFGDLKPEHTFTDGSRLRFIDPAVQWAAGPEPDVAKLLGRSILLALDHPNPAAGRQIVQGVASTLDHYVATQLEREQPRRLREVLVLWLMDTVSILSTCLSAPPGLPLTRQQQFLVTQAPIVAGLVERVSALLVGSLSGARLLDRVLSTIDAAAGSAR
ncbi:hypothetical protein EAO73_27595 [Streptomyces sp. col6]|uniref:hypothetical protein n=1 Tax=Streptomyces sp. col6 TaxID=2478958 RepID=UPI0011CDF75F|nr:hypothetical protein [Streptomyces sp. col6]TXR99726.1 hypothetical protein EAO73_27595 [Streptomyces sp. col6]